MIERTVRDLAEHVGGELIGDGAGVIRDVADLRAAGPHDVGFVRGARYGELVAGTRAGAVFVKRPLPADKPQIVVGDPYLAFAKAALLFHPVPRALTHAVHQSAVVDPGAVLEEPVEVGPHAHIAVGARVGAGSIVAAGSVVGAGAVIGRACVVHPRVTLYPGVRLGDRVVVHAGTVLGSDGFGYANDSGRWVKIPQIGGVVVDDDVEIGANVAVDCGTLGDTRIGRGTKIDNMVHVGHNCTIGEDTAVAGFCALSGSTKVGDRVTLGGHVVMSGHLEVGDDVRIGGNSAVFTSVTEPGDYVGYPLQPKTRWARTLRALDGLVELGRRVRGLEKRGDGPSSGADGAV